MLHTIFVCIWVQAISSTNLHTNVHVCVLYEFCHTTTELVARLKNQVLFCFNAYLYMNSCGGHDVASCNNGIYSHKSKYKYVCTYVHMRVCSTALLMSVRKRRIATSCSGGQATYKQQCGNL